MEEKENDGSAHYSMQGRMKNLSCIFDTVTGDGYTVEGGSLLHDTNR